MTTNLVYSCDECHKVVTADTLFRIKVTIPFASDEDTSCCVKLIELCSECLKAHGIPVPEWASDDAAM